MKMHNKLFVTCGLALTLVSSLNAREFVSEENEWEDENVTAEVEENLDQEFESEGFLADTNDNEMQPQDMNDHPQGAKFLGLALYGDFLYWGTYVTNMTTGTSHYPNAAHNHSNQFKFEWDVGFRLGASYRTPWKDVILSLDWTRFHPSSSNTLTSNDYLNKNFLPFWNDGNSDALGSGVESHTNYSIHFDQLDFTFKKEFAPAKHFKLAPFGGLRTVWMNNTVNITNTKLIAAAFPSTPPIAAGTETHTFSNLKNHISAIGLLAGLQGTFDLGMGFELFTSGDAALVTGLSKSSNSFGSIQPLTNDSSSYSFALTKNELQVKPIIDIAAGFAWEKSYKHWGIMLKAAYEAHLFFDLPQFIYQTDGFTRILAVDSQLAFQGLTLGAGVRF